MGPVSEAKRRVEAVRGFSRFYTRRLGLLQERLLESPLTLTEGRLLFEMARRPETTAAVLAEQLGIDAGYLSRTLTKLRKGGLIQRERAARDRRQYLLTLTEAGHKSLAQVDTAASAQVLEMLGALSEVEQEQVVRAMCTIQGLLGARADQPVPYVLRPHHSGDMGWVVQRHGVLYRQEYGWDEEFEALVAEIVAKFIREFDPKRERCWIAEREGENVACVFLVKHPGRPRVAQLRLLLVEPKTRGLGIGRRLVEECTRFARHAGYERIVLWTNDVLVSARRIYQEEGYQLVQEERHHSFGKDLVGQTWELEL